jgi:immune inhibitor A
MNPNLLRWLRRAAVRTLLLSITQAGGTQTPAMPPHPDLEARIRSGEVVVPSCDRDRAAGEPEAWTSPPRLRTASAAAIDTFRVLALLIRYSDATGAVPPAEFDTLLYERGTRSLRDFYGECSYGQLDLVTVNLPSSLGWKTAAQSQSYYANGEYGLGSGSYPRNARKLVEEAVAAADADVDFSRYDNDGDGRVDVLLVVHSGPGAEFTGSTGHIWSHKWSISPQLRDDVYVASYAMMPEYWSTPGDITIGVFAHELGHGFGLPDLYDTDYSSRGVGRWSVMANGSWNGVLGNSPAHFDAWCKMQLGFIAPITPTASALGAPVPQVETNPVAYRLWDGGQVAQEYFLVENRERVGFDLSLPASGLLVWHIDESVNTDNTREWYPGNTGSGHYLVAVEQADGLFELEQSQNSGNSGDVFPGSTDARSFNSTTVPNSLSYGGAVSFVAVSNISDPDSLMTADFNVSLVSGLGDDVRAESALWARNFPNPFNASTRIEINVARPGPVTLEIYQLLGGRVRSFAAAHRAAGPWQITWDGRNDAGNTVASGVYWYRVVTPGADAYGKMVLIK